MGSADDGDPERPSRGQRRDAVRDERLWRDPRLWKRGHRRRRPTPTTRPLTSPSAAPTVPNPFEIIARYDATSLGLDRPIDLAIGPNGDAYVTETNDRVSQISPDGTVIRRWGTKGSEARQFDFVGNPQDPHGSIAVGPDGKVYISDSSEPPRSGLYARRGLRPPIRQLREWGRPVHRAIRPER